jgi:hypothetical protein
MANEMPPKAMLNYIAEQIGADPASFEIWIEETKKIPLRYQIGLNENYGVTMLMELQSFK